MMKIVFILFFLIFIFILNIFLYFYSEDYSFFIKKIKYSNDIIYVEDNLNISDKTKNIGKNISNVDINNEIEEKQTIDDKGSISFGGDEIEKIENIQEDEIKEDASLNTKPEIKKIEKKEITMSVIGVYLLDKLVGYNLNKLENHSSLFDLTTEYPDNYIEYDSEDLVLYYFPSKNYVEILNIFEAISYDLPFTVNKANNFFKESFYINIKKEFADLYIRFVFNYENNIFGLKIKKDKYNELKEILNEL